MKILHVTTNYPTPEYPIFGIFVKEQVESLRKIGIDCDVFYCDGKGRGFKQYITYLPKLWWKSMFGGYDIIHCHHALSAVLLTMTGASLFKKVVLSYQNDPSNEWGDKMYILSTRSSYICPMVAIRISLYRWILLNAVRNWDGMKISNILSIWIPIRVSAPRNVRTVLMR